MSDCHLLVGLDIGSTTTCLLVAGVRLRRHVGSGRTVFDDVRLVYRPDPVFTPLAGDSIDEERLGRQLDAWLAQSRIAPADVLAGGALLTGLAARSRNAAACTRLIEARVGDAVVATADDPRLESWLAFLGGSAALSRALPERRIIQLDIGGGTTNPALGAAGNVLSTGCVDIGARHLRFAPGTYRLTGLSQPGRELLDHLRICGTVGDTLEPAARAAVVGFYVQALEAVVRGDQSFFSAPGARRLVRVPLAVPPGDEPVITFAGGVGELIYTAAAGGELPPTTAFGDLGIDLARAILASPTLSRSVDTHVPRQRGRATVYGLTLHRTEISGATLFLPEPGLLPLRDLPVVARLSPSATEESLAAALDLILQLGHKGGCLQLTAGCQGLAEIRALGRHLGAALASRSFPPHRPLVLLVPTNQGQAIGSYATDWGRRPVALLVIDEVAVPDPHFVHLGRPCGGLVPVSFSHLGSG